MFTLTTRFSKTLRVATGLCASLLALALAAGSARAAEAPSHAFLFSLTGTSPIPEPPHPPPWFNYSPDRSFEGACGVAVDSHGDIYIADYYHDAVDVYDSAGRFLTQIKPESNGNGPCGLAVDSSGDVYVDNWRQNVVEFEPSSFPPGLNTTYGPGAVIDSHGSTGVALDPASGNVYVDDGAYVAEYEPSGHPVEVGGHPLRIGLGTLGQGYGVAVSGFPATAGDVYVADAANDKVRVFNPSGALIEEIDAAGAPQAGFRSLIDSSLAVDPTDGHLYVADNLQSPFEHPAAVIDEFNAAGDYRGQLPHAFSDGEPSGLAVDGAGDVYATSGNSEEAALYAFGPTVTAHGLEVSETGAGKGAVTSAPAGIACGQACKAEYNAGESVTLTATPDAHSAFSGWSVNGSAVTCPGTGVCHLTLGADTKVIAGFAALPQKTLTVAKEGTGAGAVTSSPQGIDCGATCSAEFNAGSAVTLSAKPAALGSAFSGWKVNGDSATCPGAGPCEVTMSAVTTVEADFAAVPVHTLGVAETGSGTVSSEPAGIDCGQACSHEYNEGTEVTLTATPNPHQAFSGWSGAGCSGTGICAVTMSQARSLSASFVPILHTLTVSTSGSGAGSVLSSPAGISCGAACSAQYEDGTQLILTAVPAPGSAFAGWSGGGCSGNRTCTLTLGADTAVTASFAQYPREEPAPPAGGPTPGPPRRHHHHHRRRHHHRGRGNRATIGGR